MFWLRAPHWLRADSPVAVSLLVTMVAAGCVSLTKPKSVQECEKLPGGCIDGQQRPDAPIASDTATPPDLPWGNEPIGPRPDAGPDAAQPDLAGDRGDVAVPDGTSDNRPSDPILVSEAGPPLDGKNDLAPDKTSGPESGPEPGAERGPEPGPEPRPEPGLEPRLEPGPEPGPEPGREPGPERGPEPGPEPGPDGGADASTAACANATPVSGGNVTLNTKAAFCFVTCDNILNGWGCSSFSITDRTIRVNGTAMTACGGQLPAKKSGYYYFEVGPGGNTWDAIWWSGTAATSCPPPSGGFSP